MTHNRIQENGDTDGFIEYRLLFLSLLQGYGLGIGLPDEKACRQWQWQSRFAEHLEAEFRIACFTVGLLSRNAQRQSARFS